MTKNAAVADATAIDSETQPTNPDSNSDSRYLNSDDRLRKLRNAALKQRLIDMHAAHTKGQASEFDFFPLVVDYATRKMSRLEREFAEVANTADDFAQEVAIAVTRQLDKFRGNSQQFPAWLNGIIKRKEVDFFRELKDQKTNKLGVTVIRADEDGKEEEVDNPELHESEIRDHFLRIPKWIQGLDLDICMQLLTTVKDQVGDRPIGWRVKGDYYLRGKNYAEVAEDLGITEDAVKSRIKRMRAENLKRKRAAAEREQKRKAAAEHEQRTAFAEGLGRLRALKEAAAD